MYIFSSVCCRLRKRGTCRIPDVIPVAEWLLAEMVGWYPEATCAIGYRAQRGDVGEAEEQSGHWAANISC